MTRPSLPVCRCGRRATHLVRGGWACGGCAPVLDRRTPPEVGICLGTYQRRDWLAECLATARAACGDLLTWRIYVADGGSTDGTLGDLRTAFDVHLIEQGMLLGAVAAFDAAYGAAIDDGCQFITTLNDDLRCCADGPPIIMDAVARLRKRPQLGAVTFASDRYAPQVDPDPFFAALLPPATGPEFRCELHHGRPYLNQGVARREVHMAVARAQGDPAGRDFWDRRYHTYGADAAAGCWIWRLGWEVEAALDLKVRERMHGVDDVYAGQSGDEDPLRAHNMTRYGDSGTRFAAEWGDPARLTPCAADIARFGGRMI